MKKYTVYLSLGSNLGDREENLNKAVRLLNERAGRVISRSAFYYSEPWGFTSDNGFVNICLMMETELDPIALLDETQAVEKEVGRMKKSVGGVYSDRLIDVDILLIDHEVIKTDRLTVPHPLMEQRAFVLEPLSEIAPDYQHPILLKSIEELTKLLIN